MNQDIETLRRVHLPNEGVFLEIGDCPESPDVLELRTVRDDDKEWFGPLNLSMDPDFAIQLGSALLSAGHEKKAQLKKGIY